MNEVAGIRRSELADDGLSWNIPPSRTKNKRPHVVPLSPLARESIKVAAAASSSELLFTTTGVTAMSGFSKLKRRLDKEMSIAPWTLHDIRRTVVTGMSELGILPHVVEAVVNHVSGAKAGVAGVYNRAEDNGGKPPKPSKMIRSATRLIRIATDTRRRLHEDAVGIWP